MSLKVYTQEEVNAILPDEDGKHHFPTGDYSLIKNFPNHSVFENKSLFSKNTKFGESSIFKKGCTFGKACTFGTSCSFEESCIFKKNCSFEEKCRFGKWTTVGKKCAFGADCSFENLGWFSHCYFKEGCTFGAKCIFGKYCIFGENCTFEEKYKAKDNRAVFSFLKTRNIFHRDAYFFDFQEGLYVRTASFFGTLEQFKAKVLNDEENLYISRKDKTFIFEFCKSLKA